MASGALRKVFGPIGRWAEARHAPPTPDQELLARFLQHRDETAFAAIMERHGPMVRGVCGRVLRNRHDADDACQAAFLVLARKADAIHKGASLASWLHGVARHVALKLQHQLARRATREASAAALTPTSEMPADLSWHEVLRLVDEELQRLPRAYREALVLCYLEGRTQDEAARELGWSVGALRGRLERGRAKLRGRLLRRGVSVSATLGIAALVPSATSAALPAQMIASTARASVPMSAGQSVPGVSFRVVRLSESVLRTSSWGKLSVWLVLFLCACAASASFYLFQAPAPEIGPMAWTTPALETWAKASRLEMAHSVWSVAFSPDGKWLAAGSGGVIPTPGELQTWEMATGKTHHHWPTSNSVRCVSFAPDGQTLATAEHDGTARIREADSGRVLHTLRGHALNVDAVAFSRDGKRLGTSSWDGTIKIWDCATGAELETLKGESGLLFAVTFAGTDRVVGGGANGMPLVWQLGHAKPTFILRGHGGVAHWLAVSPMDEKVLATASWDGTVKLWNLETGQSTTTFLGHTDPVLGVAFSPDGKLLASCSGSWSKGVPTNVPSPGEVIVWDVASGKIRARLRHPDRVFGVAFAPNGETLASACWDGTITLWKKEISPPPAPTEPRKDPGIQLVVAQAQPGEPEAPAAKKDYAAEFHPSLNGAMKEVAGLIPYGPDASDCVSYEPEGMRLTLPLGFPRHRPGTGVVTDFGVRGDLEITVTFEILQEPAPVHGDPTELMLVVVPVDQPHPEKWYKPSQNRAYVSRITADFKNTGVFLADATTWNNENVPKDQWGNEKFDTIELHDQNRQRAASKSGRLRLIRSGAALSFYAADENGKDHLLLQKPDFGTKDIKNVRILARTGGSQAALDIRVTDLHLRADALPNDLSAAPRPVAVESTSSKKWWIAAALAVLLGVVALPIGAWLIARQMRRNRLGSQAAEADTFVVECSHCEQKLKVRIERLGSKVKCPKCGKAFVAVKAPPAEAEELP